MNIIVDDNGTVKKIVSVALGVNQVGKKRKKEKLKVNHHLDLTENKLWKKPLFCQCS